MVELVLRIRVVVAYPQRTTPTQDCAIPRSYYRAPDSQAIPDELLLVIFSTLDHTSLARAGSVNRQWRSTAFHRWRQLHAALLAGEHVAPPPAVAEEVGCQSDVRIVSLENACVTEV